MRERSPFARGAASIAAVCALSLAPSLARPDIARGQDLATLYGKANAAYFEGELERAIASYDQLVASGVRDPDVYHNLAVAHGRAGRLGYAVLYLERALLLSPGETELEQTLAMARAALGERRAQKEGEATVETRPPLVEALVQGLGEDTLALSVLLMTYLFFGLLLWRGRARGESLRLGLGIAAPLSALLLALSAGGLAVKADLLQEGQRAIVVQDRAVLREGPDPRAQSRGEAREGAGARILEKDGDFARVRLRGGG